MLNGPDRTIDDLDRNIIIATQSGLPLVPKPYEAIAKQLNTTADEVMSRMQWMVDFGVIRRIAAVPNHYALGYKKNGMTVWDVPDESISDLGKKVGQLSFVSHCYHRPRYLPEWPYNLFAMVHGKSQDEVDQQIVAIKTVLGEHCKQHSVLFSKRILKKTGLRLKT
ncbi:MAG: hypothetical protein KUG73_05145 [Pseudomonadales bacterium]|nr:hypothetical protein [Pseudomonadales bacterium]